MSKNIESIVYEEINSILQVKGKSEQDIASDMALQADLGLESMDLAELVGELEMILKIDPFEERFSITDIVTAGDIVKAYQDTLSGIEFEDTLSSELSDIIGV